MIFVKFEYFHSKYFILIPLVSVGIFTLYHVLSICPSPPRAMAANVANGAAARMQAMIDAAKVEVDSANNNLKNVNDGAIRETESATEKLNKERSTAAALKAAVIYGASIADTVIVAANAAVVKLEQEAVEIAINSDARVESAKLTLRTAYEKLMLLLQMQQLVEQQKLSYEQQMEQQKLSYKQLMAEQKLSYERQLADQKQVLTELTAATKAEADEKAATAKIAVAEKAEAEIAALIAKIAALK